MWSGNLEGRCGTFAISGEQAGRDWLKDTGKRNAEELNLVLKETANSWFAKVKQTADLQS